MIKLKKNGLKEFLKWGSFIGIIGVVIYPIIISPMLDTSRYKDIQQKARQGIDQDKIQPGNMKIWSDPFDRKKPDTKSQ